MAYFGKEFVLASQENFEAFVNSIGPDVSDNVKKAVLNHKGTIKLVKNGDQYTLTTSQADGSKKETTFASGVEFDDELNGTKGKSMITVNGDEYTTVSKYGDGRTLTIARAFSDNQVVATITSSNFSGAAKRVYKA